MINTIYRLVSPRVFDVTYAEINFQDQEVIIRPTHLSICKADQRYYQGSRDPKIMAEKLPMALIHEGIGKVVHDNSGNFEEGDMVVMIPNTPLEEDSIIRENYLPSSKFRASGFDGFLQDYVVSSPDRLLKINKDLNPYIASFMELISVCVHALDRLNQVAHDQRNTIGIWGDGNVGYITALLLKTLFPKTELIIFGRNMDKLSYYTFADKTYTVNNVPADLKVDHALECVGGIKSQRAIDQIIHHINPQGVISLLGVSEYPISIDTRLILEKGLVLLGNSRSGKKDFEMSLEILEEHPEIVSYLENLVVEKIKIRDLEDINSAFEMDMGVDFGKIILIWEK